MACQTCHKKKVKCCFSAGENACELCLHLGAKCMPHASQQGKRTDLSGKRTKLLTNERKDELIVEGVKVRASQPGRMKLPEKRNSSDHHTMDTLDVFSQGSRNLWLIGDTNSLECKQISRRVRMDKVGVSTYIICTCVSKLSTAATGTFCIFRRRKEESNSWHLAVVQSFSYLNEDGTDIVHLLEWSGSVMTHGQPSFYKASTWIDFMTHFTLRTFSVEAIEFYYINQVRGNSFDSLPISDATRSAADGGIQCNADGPDRVPKCITIPVHRNGLNHFSLMDLNVESTPFLTKSKLAPRKRKKEQSELSLAWSKPPNRFPTKKSLQCALVVSRLDGGCLHKDDLKSLGDAKGLFFFPSPVEESTLQEFFGVSQSDYSSVCDEINGITINEAEMVLRRYSKVTYQLCNATSLLPENHLQHSYHSYTRVFAAGDVSPELSPGDVTTINLPTINRQVSFQFLPSRKVFEYIPLSVGVVDKSLHGITVTNGIIQRIVKCLGKNGLFTYRPRCPHFGSLSFIGQRSSSTVAQPNPSEGDVKNFWYYRKHLNQVWWCLVIKVVNILTSNLVSLGLKEFFHLSKLMPFLFPNSFLDGAREFCQFAILTINFVNTIHCDENDDFGIEIDDIALTALATLLTCGHLTQSLLLQVRATIHHINTFGLTAPTTCGYQVVSDNIEVQSIQFFIGFGLGICYRIVDGWTHAFLPATHSHLTSAPLFILNGKVFSRFENCNILAWGKGKERKK
ncbi:hypothetical protein ACHAWT_001379 [Skeletonema menzelii]